MNLMGLSYTVLIVEYKHANIPNSKVANMNIIPDQTTQ